MKKVNQELGGGRKAEGLHEKDLIVLRPKDIRRILSLSRSGVYALIRQGHFPKPIELGSRAVGWLRSDIDGWIESRRRQSRKETVKP